MAEGPASTSERAEGPRPRLHLASRSPRRRLLLDRAGIAHAVAPPGLDDAELAPGRRTTPRAWAIALAHLKARSAIEALRAMGGETTIVLAADTMVVKEGSLIGKPRDEADARRILLRLEGGEHEVVSGTALIDVRTGRRRLLVDVARVRVGAIGRERIEAYVASGGWSGKAGAYNLDERLADDWPIQHQGDPGTIMGLPMRKLIPALAEFGVHAGKASAC